MDMIRVSDTTHIRYVDTFILKVIGYDMWYINIEKCIIILKNIINIWLLLCESKLKPYILKSSIIKNINYCLIKIPLELIF